MRRLALVLTLLLAVTSVALAGDEVTLSTDIPVTLIEVSAVEINGVINSLSERVELEYSSENVVASFAVISGASGWSDLLSGIGGIEIAWAGSSYDVGTLRNCRSFNVDSNESIVINRRGAGTSQVIIAAFDPTNTDDPTDLYVNKSLTITIPGEETRIVPTPLVESESNGRPHYLVATFIPYTQEGGIIDEIENVFGRNLKGINVDVDNHDPVSFSLGTATTSLCKATQLNGNSGVAITNNDNNPVVVGLALIEVPA